MDIVINNPNWRSDDNEIWTQSRFPDPAGLITEVFEFPNKMIEGLVNYILSQGFDLYNNLFIEMNRANFNDENQITNLGSLPILSALLDRDNPLFYENRQFRQSISLIPDNIVIEGLPFDLQLNLVLSKGRNKYNFDELKKYGINATYEQIQQIYTQIYNYYVDKLSDDYTFDMTFYHN